MKKFINAIEPLIWFLFGGGFFVGALLLPAWVGIVHLAAPLGLTPEGALGYDRALALASSWIGRGALLVLIILPLWNGLNHFRHWLIDLGGYERDGVMAPLCYGAALVITGVAFWSVLQLPTPA